MTDTKIKNQHTVPQCYLKKFSSNDKLHVLDKYKKEIRTNQNIKNIACEKYFYDLTKEQYKEIINSQATKGYYYEIEEQFLEKSLSRCVETDYTIFINNIINSLNLINPNTAKCIRVFNIECRIQLSLFCIVQFLRTKQYRQNIHDMFSELNKKRLYFINKAKENGVEFTNLSEIEEHTKEDTKELHISMIMNMNTSFNLIYLLSLYDFYFLINRTKVPFITSDNPVITTGGFGMIQNEVFFPITDKICLYALNIKHNNWQCNALNVSDEDLINQINIYQIEKSYNNLFSSDHHILHTYLDKYKGIISYCNKDRKRVRVN